MRVRVKISGIYNGPGHRALPFADAGAVIAVADAEYAERLIAAGSVERLAVDSAPGPSEIGLAPGPTETPAKPKAARRRSARESSD